MKIYAPLPEGTKDTPEIRAKLQGVIGEFVGPELQPDWTMVGTVEHLEAQLQNFKFKGEGWYSTTYQPDPESSQRVARPGQIDWLLVVKQYKKQSGDLYLACVYNGRDPRRNMERVAALPDLT